MNKIIAVSDLHIGQEISNTDAMDKFLDVVDDSVDLLILDGDILDLWRMKFVQIEKENHELLNKLRKVSFLTPTVWLLGNHDYSVPKKRFPDITFKKSHEYNGWHFEHGDMFDIGMKRYGWAYKIIASMYPPFYQMFFKGPAELITEDQGSWFLPMHNEAKDYAIEHDISVCVGHSHMPQILLVNSDRWMCDCGDFVDSNSYIEIIDGFPHLRRI
jgi:UDP-2,3-diacylglucosamine pyrophosphatase LpxH